MRFQTLDEWLDWQAQLHPSLIELGLERVASVWHRLYPYDFPTKVITIAGTNGKGSCVAMLDAILRTAGYRVGCYTSPHLLRYNERIRIDGQEVSDERICQAFERIDRVRGDTSLTYFEFGTLAALDIFAVEQPDIVILEVGLGGRLDAVNIIDPDVALITSIDLDHTDWLGDSREQIALEKAGIMRQGRPAVCGDPKSPESLLKFAREQGILLDLPGKDFGVEDRGESWDWWGDEEPLSDLPRPSLEGEVQLRNAAAVLQVLAHLSGDFPVAEEAICSGLSHVALAGRFQIIPGPVETILDVAHNPAGVKVLAGNLSRRSCTGRTLALFSMLGDKDVESVVKAMAPQVQGWYLAGLDDPRALSKAVLQQRLSVAGIPQQQIQGFECVDAAYTVALAEAVPGDRILVFGSFLTVSAVLEFLQ